MLVSFLLTIGCSVLCVVAGIAVRLTEGALGAVEDSAHEERLLQPLWQALTDADHWLGARLAPYMASAIWPGMLGLLFYWVACFPAAMLDIVDSAWVRRHFKLQPNRSAKPGDWRITLGLTMRHQVLHILPGLAFQLAVRGPWLYGDRGCFFRCDGRELFPAQAPTLCGLLLKVGLCTVIFDAAYCFWHKWHHLSP